MWNGLAQGPLVRDMLSYYASVYDLSLASQFRHGDLCSLTVFLAIATHSKESWQTSVLRDMELPSEFL